MASALLLKYYEPESSRTPMGHRIADLEFRTEDIVKRINVVKVRTLVTAGFFHDSLINHVVNNVTEATSRINVPVFEYDSCHIAVLVKSEGAD